LWVLPLSLAFVLAVYIYFGMPHERMLTSMWILLFKLTPFFLASLSVAWFPPKVPTLLKVVLVFGTLIPLLGFLVPRELHLAMEGYTLGFNMDPATADPTALVAMFAEFYTVMAILVPYVILMLAFAYRCGGGSAGNSLKISWAGILLMLSGYEDVMFWVANARGPFPEVATWASHVTVFLGRPATSTEFYIFMAVHAILIALVFALPLDRIGARLERAFRFLPPSQIAESTDLAEAGID
jgi:hypothetical protein